MDESFTVEEQLIRDCFDIFFDFFAKLYTLKQSKLIRFKDVRYWDYWFEIMRRVGTLKQNKNYQRLLDDYIEEYKFIGIRNLIDQYTRKPNALLENKFEKKEAEELEEHNNITIVILMPFEEKWSGEVYEEIKKFLVSHQLEPLPLDKEFDDYYNICELEFTINDSLFIVADVTNYDMKGSVKYGLDIAREIENRSIIITHDSEIDKKIPTHLTELIFKYDNNALGLIKLKDEIINRIVKIKKA